jgi:hypothetical protein
LFQLWHCAATLEDQVLKLSPQGVKLAPRASFNRHRWAFIDFVSQVPVEVQGSLDHCLFFPPMPDFGAGKGSVQER